VTGPGSSEHSWQPFHGGSSIGQEGTEMGLIIRDEWYQGTARITLEDEPRVVPFAITCTVYGWMAHTRFFGTREEAERAFDEMKPSLEHIVGLIPGDEEVDEGAKIAALRVALKDFVAHFPAL
jgi:hypothetical protein